MFKTKATYCVRVGAIRGGQRKRKEGEIEKKLEQGMKGKIWRD